MRLDLRNIQSELTTVTKEKQAALEALLNTREENRSRIEKINLRQSQMEGRELHFMGIDDLKELELTLKNGLSAVSSSIVLRMEMEIQRINMELECVVCMDKRVEMACIPCGHLVLCEKCSVLVKSVCPTCRQHIKSFLRIYR